jgi:hypothetical protein
VGLIILLAFPFLTTVEIPASKSQDCAFIDRKNRQGTACEL